MPPELAECVERANLDPGVHVIALAGNGKGFCGGYDLGQAAAGWPERPDPDRSSTWARTAMSAISARLSSRTRENASETPAEALHPLSDHSRFSRSPLERER